MKRALIVLTLVLTGCAHEEYAYSVPTQSQSWDQENLKKNDRGCPTAIFVAPNGDLKQCL